MWNISNIPFSFSYTPFFKMENMVLRFLPPLSGTKTWKSSLRKAKAKNGAWKDCWKSEHPGHWEMLVSRNPWDYSHSISSPFLVFSESQVDSLFSSETSGKLSSLPGSILNRTLRHKALLALAPCSEPTIDVPVSFHCQKTLSISKNDKGGTVLLPWWGISSPNIWKKYKSKSM